jgi:glycosyltransferase involved in cell wall biosynthesis
MQVRSIQLGELIGAQRGEVVVCIPVYGGYERFVDCLESVLAHTPAGLRILVCDDASPDLRARQHVYERARESTISLQLLYMRRQLNVGFPANVNAAFASSAPADVVLLNSDCLVAEGWLEGLREAAYASCATATATALTNHGTIVSVPERDVPCPTLPDSWSFDDAAAAVRSQSLRLRPRLPTAIGHCI